MPQQQTSCRDATDNGFGPQPVMLAVLPFKRDDQRFYTLADIRRRDGDCLKRTVKKSASNGIPVDVAPLPWDLRLDKFRKLAK
jgi:hypothetical protein